MVDLQQRGIFERPCNLHISLWIFDTLLPFFGRDNGHDVSYDGKGLSRKLILLDPSLPLFLFFFLFYYTSLYRCFFMAVLFIGNFIGKNDEPMLRIPFLSILRKRDIFLLRHSLGKLRISFLLLLLFFFFILLVRTVRYLHVTHTHTYKFFLTQILPVFERVLFSLSSWQMYLVNFPASRFPRVFPSSGSVSWRAIHRIMLLFFSRTDSLSINLCTNRVIFIFHHSVICWNEIRIRNRIIQLNIIGIRSTKSTRLFASPSSKV